MPPKVKVTKEDIITAAIDMVREKGADVLNARAIATHMGCSTQPIFSNYISMDELKQDVMDSAYSIYMDFLRRETQSNQYPPYKAAGMGYIRFAKEERELFKLLFMRDRSKEKIADEFDESTQMSIAVIQKKLGLSYEKANQFHLEMWIYVHGIASLLVTSYLPLEWEEISELVTNAYHGIRARYVLKEE